MTCNCTLYDENDFHEYVQMNDTACLMPTYPPIGFKIQENERWNAKITNKYLTWGDIGRRPREVRMNKIYAAEILPLMSLAAAWLLLCCCCCWLLLLWQAVDGGGHAVRLRGLAAVVEVGVRTAHVRGHLQYLSS